MLGVLETAQGKHRTGEDATPLGGGRAKTGSWLTGLSVAGQRAQRAPGGRRQGEAARRAQKAAGEHGLSLLTPSGSWRRPSLAQLWEKENPGSQSRGQAERSELLPHSFSEDAV